jgi:hypothetical protein
MKEKDMNPGDTYQMIPINENECVCCPAAENEKPYIMMYHDLFSQIRVRFPFSSFQMEVLNYLQVASTQLHPNGWGFVQAFETFCWAQEWHYSSWLFRVLFQPYRKDKKKKEWISLQQSDNPSLFTCYEESFKDWKYSYIKIAPRDVAVFWRDGKGRDLFPLYWSESHYSLP